MEITSGLNPAQRMLWRLGQLPGISRMAALLKMWKRPHQATPRTGNGPEGQPPTEVREPRRPSPAGGHDSATEPELGSHD